jgi:phosphoglucomutase
LKKQNRKDKIGLEKKQEESEMGYRETYESWLNNPYFDEATRAELQAIAGNEKEIEERFYMDLEFGTAGLRGVIGAGTNRMNIYTVRKATQGLANYILSQNGQEKGVAIAHDSRIMSTEFADEAALCLNANGIKAYVFDSLRPTPELSFAVKHYGTTAGLNITASHNPKEYNGYKVYWSDGAQLPPQHAAAIARNMERLDIFNDIQRMDFDDAVRQGLVEFMGAETDEAFLSNVLRQPIDPDVVRRVADRFKIVYTPFHGAGWHLVPEALHRLGMTQVIPVKEQMVLDGTFPTVKSPNPENPEGFYLAVDLAKEVGSDLILGTDPDSDRVGVMVRGADGEYHTITGNQMGVLLLDYIITARRRKGTLPENAAAISTIVTSKMVRRICDVNDIHFDETFTGFKFMAEKLAEYQRDGSYQYVLAFEESYGYMMGDYVRDKDAVTACVMITEMAAYYFEQGMTLAQALDALYEKYGFYGERTLNLVMPGLDGLEKMRALMAQLRREPLQEIAGTKVVRMRDYQDGSVYVMGLGKMDKTPISGSNVLYFELDDGCSFIVRPSGTEPKIKVYILGVGATRAECDERVQRYAQFAETLRG